MFLFKKKNKIKKFTGFLLLSFFVFFSFLSFSPTVSAQIYPTPDGKNLNLDPFNTLPGNIQTAPKDTKTSYNLLAPLPGPDGLIETYETSDDCPLGKYLNIMISLFIGIAAVLAMVMIVMGGIEYMTSELISSKEAGKEKIKNAVLGLVLALGAYLILNTINPNLLNVCLRDVPKVEITVLEGDDLATSFTPISKENLEAKGVYCPGTGGSAELVKIASSFNNRVTYSQEKRSTVTNETIYLDCSSFVKQVYSCAGLPLTGYNTKTMFPGSESLTGKAPSDTKAGDLLGWIKGESKKFPNAGHIFMAMNSNFFIEVSSGGKGLNNAVRVQPMNHYQGSVEHIIRVK